MIWLTLISLGINMIMSGLLLWSLRTTHRSIAWQLELSAMLERSHQRFDAMQEIATTWKRRALAPGLVVESPRGEA